MKRLVLLFISLLSVSALAQDTLTTYYVYMWKETDDKDAAKFYSQTYKTELGVWKVEKYTISGQLIMTGSYETETLETETGEFIFYRESGEVNVKGAYKWGKEEGEWVRYHKNGKLQDKRYYEGGRIKTIQQWNEDGEELEPVYDYVDTNPEYPGGADSMAAFINGEFEYPEISRRMGEQGTIYVQFVVGKEGDIEDAFVIKGVSPALDKESVRVISAMPKWEPGKYDGKAVKVRYTIPIRARLGNTKKIDRKKRRLEKKQEKLDRKRL